VATVGSRARYGYDEASHLESVSDGTNSATNSCLDNSPFAEQIAFATNGTTVMTTPKAYDFLNRLTAMTSAAGGSNVAVFNYAFVYDGWNLVAILNPQSAIVQSFLWGLDLSGHTGSAPNGAGGVGRLPAMQDSSAINAQPPTHFVAYDGNGNVAALVNATNGTGSASYEYGPFGEVLRATGPMAKANSFRFSTKYQDDETDQLYYGYRSYNPSVGRWLGRDPIEEEGFRTLAKTSRRTDTRIPPLYAFVGNSPLNRADYLGLRVEPPSGPADHCQDPCGDAKKKGLDAGDYGGVICCGGKKHTCVWKAGRTSGSNSTATAIVTQCITEHEDAHHDDTNCPKIWCYDWPTRPDFKKGKDPNAEECASYYVHLDCLQSNISRCGSDQQCLDEV